MSMRMSELDRLFPDDSKTAILSPCGTYRYMLGRHVLPQGSGTCNFIMLNPSTADATEDDPTITRCIGFAKRWGFADLVVTNLFAFRATDPRELSKASDPIGPDNDRLILKYARDASFIVYAWGQHGTLKGRDKAVLSMLRGFPTFFLQKTKAGHPGHPLYLPSRCTPLTWEDEDTDD